MPYPYLANGMEGRLGWADCFIVGSLGFNQSSIFSLLFVGEFFWAEVSDFRNLINWHSNS